MGAIFQSLGRSVAAGVVLVILMVAALRGGKFDHAWGLFFMRWLHVLCGVMWVGLLWYLILCKSPQCRKFRTSKNRRCRR